MILKPASVEELAELLANANARGEKISSVSLAALNRLLEHTAEDMTATVEAGVTLAELQRLNEVTRPRLMPRVPDGQ